MMRGKSTIYCFDNKGDLSRVKTSQGVEVKLWKKGAQINYTVSKEGKVVYGSSIVEGNIPLCSYCHQQIETEPKKLGIFDFHWSCFVKFHSWQRKLKVRRR